MAGKVSLPPSLSSFAQASDENERKQEARKHAVITAMRALPLIETANSQLLGFVSAFEMTYYAVEQKQREASASPRTVKKQLNYIADKCSDLAKYLEKMHRDAIHEWGRAAGVGGLVSIWQLSQILDESASSAEQALSKLTVKPINQGTKAGSFEVFLERVFKAYGIEANLQHRIRDLKKSRFWR
jgi:predicted component of type VI protein secretion system